MFTRINSSKVPHGAILRFGPCVLAATAAVLWLSCAAPDRRAAAPARGGETFDAAVIFQGAGDVVLGEPLALSADLRGDIFIADGLPGRVVHFIENENSAVEFETPRRSPGFYPSDLKVHGFFLYAIDKVGRMLLRFDQDGAYRDILLNFNQEILGRRISPYGMDVDPSGRVIITDIENHQVLIFDSYLSLEIAFGSFGSFPGQMDAPQGVSFTKTGELVVADTGNRRVQFFREGGDLVRIIPREGQDNPLVAPRRAALDNSGRLYVADPEAGRLFIFDEAGALERSLFPAGIEDFRPTDVEVSRDGTVYVTDAASRSLFVFKVMSY